MLSFQDNQPLLELFQGRDGIFHALDQQAMLGDKGSVTGFLSTLTKKHGKNNNLFVPGTFSSVYACLWYMINESLLS